MEASELKSELVKRMPTARYEHVLRVTVLAEKLASLYGVSVKSAQQAALFHDIAKFMDKQELRAIMEAANIDTRLFSFHHELWHGPVGAIIANKEFGVVDEDILNAIRYHTTGRAGMSDLEKIIYIADMLEPGREFPGIQQLRAIAYEHLHKAMGACIEQSVQFLLSKKSPIYPDSIDCYNEHMMLKGNVKE